MLRAVVIVLILFCSGNAFAQSKIYEVNTGRVVFHSDAPNELIYAYSDVLKGGVDLQKNTFLFKIEIASFNGFNSPLQKEHFNENYMETVFYPVATYSGKIIEDVDLSKNGEYTIRAKGKLMIHGIEQEKIINVHIVSKAGKLFVNASFVILLADYNIKIPRIVSDKLSPKIDVKVNCVLSPKI